MSRLLIGRVSVFLTVAELCCQYLYVIVFVWVSLHFEMLQSFTESFGSRYSKGMPLVPLSVRRHEDRVIWRYWSHLVVFCFWSKEMNSVGHTGIAVLFQGNPRSMTLT